MANYAEYLAHFNYDIIFKKTKENANADYCSRAPLLTTSDSIRKLSYHKEEEVKDSDEFDEFVIN